MFTDVSRIALQFSDRRVRYAVVMGSVLTPILFKGIGIMAWGGISQNVTTDLADLASAIVRASNLPFESPQF